MSDQRPRNHGVTGSARENGQCHDSFPYRSPIDDLKSHAIACRHLFWRHSPLGQTGRYTPGTTSVREEDLAMTLAHDS
jgi:hypothetical protein